MEKPKALNYKLTFCRITLASKIFARNNYFPLFRVMTPKDARRRLLRKLQGPLEHYIPVLLSAKVRNKLSKGSKRVKHAPNYGKRPHKIDEDFRYVNFKFDQDNDKHKRLIALTKTKRRLKGKFVYSVFERDTGLVVNGQTEDAIRDGDIADIMISDFSDKVIVRYKTGDKVTVPIDDWDGPMAFFEGEGATTKETEDKHHYGKSTMGLAQIYEMKEKGAADDELERLRMAAAKKAKAVAMDVDTDVVVKKEMKVVLDNLDYADDFDDYEAEMQKFKKKMAAAEEESKEDGGDDEDAADKAEPVPEIPGPEPVAMSVGDMDKTVNVGAKLVDAGLEVLGKLPQINEINDIVKIIGDGKRTEMADVSGIVVKMGEAEKFLVGQMVTTDGGEIFVPGQTVDTDDGTKYMPGMTVNVDETPTFIAGLIMANDDNDPVFLPGQATIGEDGQLKLADEGERICPTGMKQMDVDLDVNDVTEDDEERKIARKLAEEEAKREKEEKERIEAEKKKREEEKKAREEALKKKREEEDKAWAKLSAVERAKKERLRIEREKREQEKHRKEEAEREQKEKERQEREREERAKLRAEREEVERQRMIRLREEKKKQREAARRRAEKEAEEKRKLAAIKEEERRKAQAAAKAIADAEEDERLAKIAEFIPKEIPRKEIVVDEEKEMETQEMKRTFMKEEHERMERVRQIRIKPRKKIEIPKIEEYVPLPPVVVSEKLKEMEEQIHTGNFFVDHKKYIPNIVHRLRVKFYNQYDDESDFKDLKAKYIKAFR